MVLWWVIQSSSSLTTLGNFMVILFASTQKKGVGFFIGFFSFLMVYYADELSVQIQGCKSRTPLS